MSLIPTNRFCDGLREIPATGPSQIFFGPLGAQGQCLRLIGRIECGDWESDFTRPEVPDLLDQLTNALLG